jgi:hypothetical protein
MNEEEGGEQPEARGSALAELRPKKRQDSKEC